MVAVRTNHTRFVHESISDERLKTRERSARSPEIEHDVLLRMRRKIVENESGWTVREVKELIRRCEGDVHRETRLNAPPRMGD